jgi:hypothetical protein
MNFSSFGIQELDEEFLRSVTRAATVTNGLPSLQCGCYESRNRAAKRRRMNTKNRNVLKVLMSLVAAAMSGAVFILALFRQYAMVEVAASILTGLQVFFLSSAISDLLDKKKETSRGRNSAVVLLTIFLVAFYSFTRYFH